MDSVKRQNLETAVSIDLWQSKTDRADDYYRIPALAVTNKGSLIAVADLRYKTHSDLGWRTEIGAVHRIDLLVKYSSDNGRTWSDETNITNIPSDAEYGYGDAAIVADRETDEVLILCAWGDTGYGQGGMIFGGKVRTKLKIAKIVSLDGGLHFLSPRDITESIYNLNTSWKNLFFASGRIMQSRYIKTGSHYRIYSAILSEGFGNAVLYSDNFGTTWKVLGDASVSPVNKGDEAKIEELPNGNVLISSRTNCGRFFNIFAYTQADAGIGNWQSSYKFCGLGGGQAANGEILILSARSTVAKKPLYLALQSLPAGLDGKNRKNLSIFWREVDAAAYQLSDFADTKKWDWEKNCYTVYTGESAYSAMLVQQDGRIGFLYEKTDRPGVYYDICYKNLLISDITGGLYEGLS